MSLRRLTPVLLLPLLLAACGSDVKLLLAREASLVWYAETVGAAAADLDPALAEAVYRAEAAKYAACSGVNEATWQRLQKLDLPLGEQFHSDVTRLVARLIPITAVERCARAHEAYESSVLLLARRLAEQGIDLPPPD